MIKIAKGMDRLLFVIVFVHVLLMRNSVCVCVSEPRWTSSISQSASIDCVTEAKLTALCRRSRAPVDNERKCHLDV